MGTFQDIFFKISQKFSGVLAFFQRFFQSLVLGTPQDFCLRILQGSLLVNFENTPEVHSKTAPVVPSGSPSIRRCSFEFPGNTPEFVVKNLPNFFFRILQGFFFLGILQEFFLLILNVSSGNPPGHLSWNPKRIASGDLLGVFLESFGSSF